MGELALHPQEHGWVGRVAMGKIGKRFAESVPTAWVFLGQADPWVDLETLSTDVPGYLWVVTELGPCGLNPNLNCWIWRACGMGRLGSRL